MKLNITRVQTQTTNYSASLEKSIVMLLLPHAELNHNIEQELQNNPLLEAEFEPIEDQEKVLEPLESQLDLERFNALMNLSSPIMRSTSEEEVEFESSSMANTMTLEDHLFKQLYWEFADLKMRKIGDFIIGNLDKDGFLQLSCEEIAQAIGGDLKLSTIKEVLGSIQNFDPLGIATANFKECLLVQLQSRQSPYRQTAIQIIEKYLDDLGGKRYAAIAKKLSVPLEQVHQAGLLIASLEPRPARNYRPIDPSIYIEPDLFIRKNEDGEFTIETNKSGLPKLRISSTYRNLLNQPNLSVEDRNFIKERITNAINFIRSLDQRGDTLTAIARYILKHQKEFFDGEDSCLSPLKLKDVADHLERCESTISRAISNKYIDTPQGLFPLKFFFSHNVSRQEDENVSAHAVKQELAQLIEDENKHSPLSDQEIQAHFNAQGVHLARRTITKYRQILNIPASYMRKKP